MIEIDYSNGLTTVNHKRHSLMENAFTVCKSCQELQIKTYREIEELQKNYQMGLITLNECINQIKNQIDCCIKQVDDWLLEEELDTVHLEMYSRIPQSVG